jgi:hypothetical protein
MSNILEQCILRVHSQAMTCSLFACIRTCKIKQTTFDYNMFTMVIIMGTVTNLYL